MSKGMHIPRIVSSYQEVFEIQCEITWLLNLVHNNRHTFWGQTLGSFIFVIPVDKAENPKLGCDVWKKNALQHIKLFAFWLYVYKFNINVLRSKYWNYVFMH